MQREQRLLGWFLAAALLHGLIYVFLMPPWQHYEEPSHFEYAWLIATQRRIPPVLTYDNAIRRELAASMIAHDFFRDLDFLPDLDADPIWIGHSVVGAVPLYHILVSVPLALAQPLGVTGQLYAARLLSLGLYLATILLSYLTVRELTPPGHALRWAVPATLALLPGFTDLMTALNNDVGATFFFTLFLWAGVRLITRGFSAGRVTALAVTALLCALTKNTVLLAVPLAVLAVGGAFLRRGARALLWVVPLFAALGAAALAAFLGWGDAAAWYRTSEQTIPTRTRLGDAPIGSHAIRLSPPPGGPGAQVMELIPADQVEVYRGQNVSLGAWMWASEPRGLSPLRLVADGEGFTQHFQLDTQPAFYAFQVQVPKAAERIDVRLQVPGTGADAEALSVFFDGVILLPGEWPLDQPPVFDDLNGQRGTWGERAFTNGIRNASGELGWLWVRPGAEALFRRVAEGHLSPSRMLASVQDWPVTRLLHAYTGRNLFETFWARFGWGQVSLPGVWYWILAAGTLLALGLSIPGILFQFQKAELPIKIAVTWLALAGLAIWLGAWLRGFFTVPLAVVYIPTARYAYPAITPTIMVLSVGTAALIGLAGRTGKALYLAGFLILDLVSIVTIYQFYR